MPELPEVETVVRQLDDALRGARIARIKVFDARISRRNTGVIRGAACVCVRRIGKQILIELNPAEDHGERSAILVHLRMTGRLVWRPLNAPPDPEPVRARVLFDRGELLFKDLRRFGTFEILRPLADIRAEGVEPLGRELTPRALKRLLRDSRQPIKPWLMRQDRLAGIGNIYASEILHDAGIDPRRAAGTLKDEEIAHLIRSTRRILRRAIRHCGTTFDSFQDARGAMGGYARFLAVYAREGLPCRRCGAPIRRLMQQQRSGFYCEKCQR